MQLNLFFHSLAMLCSLASVTFATVDTRARGHAAFVLGFVLAAIGLDANRLPDPVWVGSVVACLGALALVRPGWATVLAAVGGALAGVWMSMLQVGGVPLPVAVVVAATPPVMAAIFSRRMPGFAPVALREEALLLMLVLGIVVAAGPGVAAGWQSAVTMNLQQKEVASEAVPAWALLVTLGAAAAGGLSTVWMRR